MHPSICILICSAIIHHLSSVSGQPMDETEKRTLFDSFVKKFNKNYRDENELNFRFQVFKSTLDRISQLNAQRKTSTDAIFGITSYSDLMPDEFKLKVINEKVNRRQPSVNHSSDSPNKSSSPNKPSSVGAPGSSSGELDSSAAAKGELSSSRAGSLSYTTRSSGKTSSLGEDDKSPNAPSSSEAPSSSDAQSSLDTPSSLSPDDQRNRIGTLDRSKPRPEQSGRTNANGRESSNLSPLDKLIEKHLSLHGQLGGHLDASEIDLDLLVNSFASDHFKQINLHLDHLSLPGELWSEMDSDMKTEQPNSKELNSKENQLNSKGSISNRLERPAPIAPKSRAKRSVNRLYFNAYDEALPASYPRRKDWRESNAVSAIDNQGVCGACWAHSTLETIESMAAIRYSWPINSRLSVQQLIDCSSNNYGCLGGDTCAVLAWIAANRIKIASAKAYPTRSNAGECRIRNDQLASGFTVLRNFTCTNFTNNEIELIKLLATHGPVATTADATLWQDYLGGIIQFNCGREANHAVQIVGYNLETETPYYIVRNTWSSSFGLNGYLHVAIGGNLCALEERVSALDVEMI